MSELMVFNSPEFGEIRSVEIDGEPWLVGKDVAAALGYSDTDKAVRSHVDEEDKLTRQFGGSGQNRSMTIINESGLYSLILSSKLPGAKKFKRWVTSEVLPSIRKTGGYLPAAAEKTLADLTAAVQLLTEQVETLMNRESGPAALAAPELETSAYWKVSRQPDGPAAKKRWMRMVNEKLELLAARLRSSSRSVLYQIYHILESEHKVSLDEERIRVVEEYRLEDCSVLASIFYNETLRDTFQRVVDYNLAPENRGW